MTKKTTTPENITPSEKRLSEAQVYLKFNDIDINSRTDTHYKKALEIAAGNDNYVMLRDWFTESGEGDEKILMAECPHCGDAVVYNDGCVNCNSNFIFK